MRQTRARLSNKGEKTRAASQHVCLSRNASKCLYAVCAFRARSLEGATLSDANLTNANALAAVFDSANLTKAVLEGAR